MKNFYVFYFNQRIFNKEFGKKGGKIPNHAFFPVKSDLNGGKFVIRCVNNICNYTIRSFDDMNGGLDFMGNREHHYHDTIERLPGDFVLKALE
jgi:hypothetical protein